MSRAFAIAEARLPTSIRMNGGSPWVMNWTAP